MNKALRKQKEKKSIQEMETLYQSQLKMLGAQHVNGEGCVIIGREKLDKAKQRRAKILEGMESVARELRQVYLEPSGMERTYKVGDLRGEYYALKGDAYEFVRPHGVRKLKNYELHQWPAVEKDIIQNLLELEKKIDTPNGVHALVHDLFYQRPTKSQDVEGD